MRPLHFNGKFLTASPTGVHRVAEELIRAVDMRLAETRDAFATILHPREIRRTLPLQAIPHRAVGRASGPLWEQTELPRAGAGGLIVNLCNLGPVASRNAVTMIHDAQVRETPASYSAPFRAYYNAVQPVVGRRHQRILTVSHYAREALIRHRIAAPSAIRVVPNGVDHVRRTPPDRRAAEALGLRPGGFVLALANAQAHKNIAMLIRAFRDERLCDIPLVLFGNDPAKAIERSATPNVIHTGRITDAVLYGLMTTARAYACPSLTEGFGLPPLEALAIGTPVIAAARGALPEVLGDAAVYADPASEAAWVEAILNTAPDGAQRARAVAHGQAHAAGFTWQKAGDLLLEAIGPVAAERRAA